MVKTDATGMTMMMIRAREVLLAVETVVLLAEGVVLRSMLAVVMGEELS